MVMHMRNNPTHCSSFCEYLKCILRIKHLLGHINFQFEMRTKSIPASLQQISQFYMTNAEGMIERKEKKIQNEHM